MIQLVNKCQFIPQFVETTRQRIALLPNRAEDGG
jgi:hypothetical protein